MHSGHYDVTEQREAVVAARMAAAEAMAEVAYEAKLLVKAFSSRSARPDTTAWLGAVSRARRAEETYDLAMLDLRTAGGEDA